jgi:poly(3-hydroxybutyrate) depolymerase
MRFIRLRASLLACCTAGTLVFGVACGSSNSDGSHASGGHAGSPVMGAGGSGAASESGGSSGSSGTSGTTSTGGSAGGSGGSSGGTGGGTGGAMMSAGGSAAAGTSGSTSKGGSAGTPGGSGGSGASSAAGGATGGTAGGSAASSGGSAGEGASGGGMSASGGKGGGGLTGAMPSPGCGSTAMPATGALQIDVSGTTRDYILRLPDGYDASTPHRIIFAFHGMQGSAEQVDTGGPPNAGLPSSTPYYDIMQASTDTIFVAGQALSGGWTNTNNRDLDYVQALVTDLESKLCIDESRVFATGFSFGAIMTITIACNMPDVFRAVAAMSGSLQNGCPANDHSIAYWASHGTMDTTIDISKGEEARDEFVKRNKCSMTTMPTTPDGCVAYQGCADGYPVNWCPFDGIHQPPPFSGPAIWAFLSQF